MMPFQTMLTLDRTSDQAIYLQLSNQFIDLIKQGTLGPGTQLPGTRTLAEILKVHRKTVVAVYDELAIQGWIETQPQKGTFVHRDLPLLTQSKIDLSNYLEASSPTVFKFYHELNAKGDPIETAAGIMSINDGLSDERLVPAVEIGRIYRQLMGKSQFQKDFTYGSTYGQAELRKTLRSYLNKTRGLTIEADEILITRGSQMGIYLAAKALLRPGDCIVVGETNYSAADQVFYQQGAEVKRVRLDDQGIVVSDIAAICQIQKIQAVYVTPHHHHPTTVTLSAERRLSLLNLAAQYGFAIIEDDYDYDFHYKRAPILPLASHDRHGHVIYIGSICKSVAPVFRVGYMVAQGPFIETCASIRRYIDRQGDALLELAFARFIKAGDLDRHINKVWRIYRQRRDCFCELLKTELGNYIDFEIPSGGMAVWVKLKDGYSWAAVAQKAKNHQLSIGDWSRYDPIQLGHNAIRIGFANFNKDEMTELVRRLKASIQSVKPTLQ